MGTLSERLGEVEQAIAGFKPTIEELNRVVLVGNGEPSLQMSMKEIKTGVDLLKWLFIAGCSLGLVLVTVALVYVSRH